MEKAIEIKRRAQRCLQNNDLDGALSEYDKLTRAEDSDPINFVVVADLFFKKGDKAEATQRYLQAADAYSKAGLYKNAIAICKKMTRLAMSPTAVLQRLAELHALDGLSAEAALYHQEYAERLANEQRYREAAESQRRAFEIVPDDARVLEKASEWFLEAGDAEAASSVLTEAARHLESAGRPEDAVRVRARAGKLRPGAGTEPAGAAPEPGVAAQAREEAPASGEGGVEGLERRPAFVAPATEGAVAAEPIAQEVRLEEPGAVDSGVEEFAVEEPEVEQLAIEEPEVEELAIEEPEVEKLTIEEPEVEELTIEEPADEGPAADVTPPAPVGLRFADAAPAEAPPPRSPLAEIEDLLHEAGDLMRSGDRDAAAAVLVKAARAYEAGRRLDSAASIYRSLGRSTHATPEVLRLWLRNCELRGDAQEAAGVACALGDLALNEEDAESAREWFTRALRHQPDHELANRRLQRMSSRATEPAMPVPPAPAAEAPDAGPPAEAPGAVTAADDGDFGGDPACDEDGRVEVAVGRAQAVTFDIGALISEFHRGVESQLSGDAQSQYDLGMTYREMGFLDQAVECFRAAGNDPELRLRATEMIGRSLLDQGRFDEAAEEFARALEHLDLEPEASVGLRYQLGLAHEVAGRPQVALTEFERVYAEQPNYPDVAQKIRVLRRALESV